MKQPRKDVLREQLALAADEIIRLRAIIGQFEQFGFSVTQTKAATWVVHENHDLGSRYARTDRSTEEWYSWVERILRRLLG